MGIPTAIEYFGEMALLAQAIGDAAAGRSGADHYIICAKVSHRPLLAAGSSRRVALEKFRDADDCRLQVIGALPPAQGRGIGSQLDDLLADHRRMRRVVAGHDQ